MLVSDDARINLKPRMTDKITDILIIEASSSVYALHYSGTYMSTKNYCNVEAGYKFYYKGIGVYENAHTCFVFNFRKNAQQFTSKFELTADREQNLAAAEKLFPRSYVESLKYDFGDTYNYMEKSLVPQSLRCFGFCLESQFDVDVMTYNLYYYNICIIRIERQRVVIGGKLYPRADRHFDFEKIFLGIYLKHTYNMMSPPYFNAAFLGELTRALNNILCLDHQK